MWLALDTTEIHCSIALVDLAGHPLATQSEAITRGHAEAILPGLDRVMAQAGASYADLTSIAVTTGPGNFTGVRVGLSVARGLGLALGVPVQGASGLQVLAHQAGGGEEGDWLHCVMAGRGRHAFYQRFQHQSGCWAEASQPELFDIELILNKIAIKPGRITGSAAKAVSNSECEKYIDPVSLVDFCQKFPERAGRPDPLYLKPADAAIARPVFPA